MSNFKLTWFDKLTFYVADSIMEFMTKIDKALEKIIGTTHWRPIEKKKEDTDAG